MYDFRYGSRGEELDLSISGPVVLPRKRTLERMCWLVAFVPILEEFSFGECSEVTMLAGHRGKRMAARMVGDAIGTSGAGFQWPCAPTPRLLAAWRP